MIAIEIGGELLVTVIRLDEVLKSRRDAMAV